MRPLYHWLAGLLAAATTSCVVAPQKKAPPAVPRVVLVHGFLETGSSFRTMKKRLEKRGYDCFVPKLVHMDGRGGLNSLATRLKKDIDARFGPHAPINIIGFSMGGIVSREYLQNLGGAKRCRQLITVSSPHHGTKAARLYPSQGVVEMRPGSPFLAKLESTEHQLGKMPVSSFRTPMDLVILPPTSSIWDRAENREYPVILHPLMLTSSRVLADIEQRLDASKN